jgi:CheY-like chemotaxis protein
MDCVKFKSKESETMMGKKARILLLEDDREWIDTLSEYLEEDYEVYSATSLEEAELRLVELRPYLESQEVPFHLAIVDISLILGDSDDEQGFYFIEDLRTRDILRDVSIIVVTAYPRTERVRTAFKDYKVHDFIDKMTLVPGDFKKEVAEAIADTYLGSLRSED